MTPQPASGRRAGVEPLPVVMFLDPPWYDLILTGAKRHEFRKHFPTGTATTWYVYLTAPRFELRAVIDLGPARPGSPDDLAALADADSPGSGRAVRGYLAPNGGGFAMPILGVREYPALSCEELTVLLGAEPAVHRYHLIGDDADPWRTAADRLTSRPATLRITTP